MIASMHKVNLMEGTTLHFTLSFSEEDTAPYLWHCD
jgi:hypothetical protein